jgi:hypothetical protein
MPHPPFFAPALPPHPRSGGDHASGTRYAASLVHPHRASLPVRSLTAKHTHTAKSTPHRKKTRRRRKREAFCLAHSFTRTPIPPPARDIRPSPSLLLPLPSPPSNPRAARRLAFRLLLPPPLPDVRVRQLHVHSLSQHPRRNQGWGVDGPRSYTTPVGRWWGGTIRAGPTSCIAGVVVVVRMWSGGTSGEWWWWGRDETVWWWWWCGSGAVGGGGVGWG